MQYLSIYINFNKLIKVQYTYRIMAHTNSKFEFVLWAISTILMRCWRHLMVQLLQPMMLFIMLEAETWLPARGLYIFLLQMS